jgi:hypothetical protein
MAKNKYQKYILTDLVLPDNLKGERAAFYAKKATRILWLEDFVMKGAPSIILSWYWKVTEEGGGTPAHTHDFDEVLGLIGSDPDNPHDLCGEVEIWLEDEKYIVNKSCLILAPKGLKHCPLRVLKVDRPILFMAFSITDKYEKKH